MRTDQHNLVPHAALITRWPACKLAMAVVARTPVFSPPQAARAPHICAARQRRGAAARAAKEEASTATLPPAAAAAASSPAAAANPADRKYLSLLPPFFSRATRLEEYGPGLWGLVQPLKLVGAALAAACSPCVVGPPSTAALCMLALARPD